MPVELVCSGQVVDVSKSSALRVDSGGAGGATMGVGLGGAGCATSGVDLGGVVTENDLSGGTASGVGSGGA